MTREDGVIVAGEVRRAYVGLTLGRILLESAERFQPAERFEPAERFGLAETEGMLVPRVAPDSPAARAGLQPGDVVTDVGGGRVRSIEQFLGELRGLDIGEQVRVSLLRGDQPTSVCVKLAEAV